jgi:hypothetical protein
LAFNTESEEADSFVQEEPRPARQRQANKRVECYGRLSSSSYYNLRSKDAEVREALLDELHLLLELQEECTLCIKKQHEVGKTPEGKCDAVAIVIYCRNTKCCRLRVIVAEPPKGSHETGFWVEEQRRPAEHKQCAPRPLRGRKLKEEVAKRVLLLGGPSLYRRDMKSKHLHGEIPMQAVRTTSQIQRAVRESRLPADGIDNIGGFEVEAFRLFQQSAGIDFVRAIVVHPFWHVTFGLDRQLRLFGSMSKGRFLSLDATGGVIRAPGEKAVFYFAAVFQTICPAGEKAMSLPAMECFTDSQSSMAIDYFLRPMRQLLTQKHLPLHVSVDFCWASIHSVLKHLPPHPTNIVSFLRHLYQIMINLEPGRIMPSNQFKLSICRSHTLHAWTHHSSFSANMKKKRFQKAALIRGCQQVAYALSMTEAEEKFRKLCLLCLSNKKSPEVLAVESEFKEGCELEEKKVEKAVQEANKDEDAEESDDVSDLDFSDGWRKRNQKPRIEPDPSLPTSSESIKGQSPFFRHFKAVYDSVVLSVDLAKDRHKVYDDNEWENKEFLNYFLATWLTVFGLWSIMTAGRFDEKKGQIRVPTNGSMERYNRQLKERELEAHQPSAPVQFLRKHHKVLEVHCDAVEVDGRLLGIIKSPSGKATGKATKSKTARRKATVSGKAHYEQPAPPKKSKTSTESSAVLSDLEARIEWKSPKQPAKRAAKYLPAYRIAAGTTRENG